MKFAASLAIVVLVNNLSAVEATALRDDDLFSDDGQAEDTLKSIKAAEKIHNTYFNGLNQEDQKEAIKEKSSMQFNNDEFIKNDVKKFQANFLQLEDKVYPDPQPISVKLAQIQDFEDVRNTAMLSRTQEQDMQVLAGSSLNDDEDYTTTLDSIKTAERMTGAQFAQPSTEESTQIRTGNPVHNFLEDDHRIYTSELDNALVDKNIVEQKGKNQQIAERKKQALLQEQQKAQQKQEDRAAADLAIHFRADDEILAQQHGMESDSDSDSDSSDDE